jgi:carbon-monoxide dehydrogenase small subunit
VRIEIDVNGEHRVVEASPWKRLLDVLREDLRLAGTKEGCGEGECGACTVLIDGRPAVSCLVAAGQAHGRAVTTIEGLARGDLLHAVQEALVAHGGAQCGICTPGIALTAAWAVACEPTASRARLRELLAGNLCRCTGYGMIVDAVAAAATGTAAEEAPG